MQVFPGPSWTDLLLFVLAQVAIISVIAWAELKRRKKQSESAAATSELPTSSSISSSVPVSVAVTQFRTFQRRDVDGGVPFFQYKLETTAGDEVYVSWRRYRQFERFRKLVMELGARTTTFPPKSTIGEAISGSDGSPKFAQRRLVALNEYMASAVSGKQGPGVASASRAFLNLPEHIKLASPSAGSREASGAEAAAIAKRHASALAEGAKAVELMVAAASCGVGEGHSGWKLSTTHKGCKIYLKTEGAFVYSMGVIEIAAPLHVVLAFIGDDTTRPKYDDLWDHDKDFEFYDEPDFPELGKDAEEGSPMKGAKMTSCMVRYTACTTPSRMIMAPRDNLSVYASADLASGASVIGARGVTHPSKPPSSDYVRAWVTCAGVMISPVAGEPNRCTLTKVECVDPNGALPKWLVNKAAPLRALMAQKVAHYVEEIPSSSWPPAPTEEDKKAFIAQRKRAYMEQKA